MRGVAAQVDPALGLTARLRIEIMNDGAPPRRIENLVIAFLKREARRGRHKT